MTDRLKNAVPAGEDPVRLADGSDRVRRGLARHHPGLLRPSCPAGRATRRVPRLARRQQRPLHQEDRREVRALGQGVPDDGGAAPRAPAAVHGLLGDEPLPGRRGLRPRPGLLERPGERAADGQPRGVHGVVRGDRLPVPAGAGLPQGRAQAEHLARDRPADGRGLHRGGVRRPGGRGPDGRRARHGDLQPAVRRPDPGRRAAALDPTAAAGHGADPALPAPDRVHAARRPARV